MKVKQKYAFFLSARLAAEFAETCKNGFQEWFKNFFLEKKIKKFEPKKELIQEFPAVSFFRASVGDIDGLKDVIWSLNTQPYLSWPFWLIKQKGIC